MNSKITNVRAVVTLQIEVDAECVWGANCTVDQVHEQAVVSALGLLRKHLNGKFRVVGQPRVIVVSTETEKP